MLMITQLYTNLECLIMPSCIKLVVDGHFTSVKEWAQSSFEGIKFTDNSPCFRVDSFEKESTKHSTGIIDWWQKIKT